MRACVHVCVCVRMYVCYLCYIEDNFPHNQKYQFHLIKYVYIFVLVLCTKVT